MHRTIRIAAPLLSLALLAACAATPGTRTPEPVYSPRGSTSVSYGQVRSIEAIGIAPDQPQGAGAVVGGIVGAVVGRQFADSSHGKNVGMVAGAVGGAIVGNEMEKNARRDQSNVRVTVQLDHGGSRVFEFKSAGDLRVGDRVRIEGNQLFRL
jgi:outer membrane lipoprotein SlyB